ncbi:hypothetical protein SAMN06269173_108125 [Hymenobacter mucosus]|uniref:Copper-binding protein MbnP-like domain-containing protein n=2 Tax=Hymenobacter mucosus TaxID=1411120 RepID=A0A238ZL65_9BACT|nr:hypothetical protein SAMN06269173_108125 [Hymenobacter mucosus]
MKLRKISAIFFYLLFSSAALTSCKEDSDMQPKVGTLDVAIDHVVGTATLALNTGSYATPAGDQFTVSTFKYYLSNFTLKKADGTTHLVPESYYLVDEAVPASKTFTLSGIPAGDYTSLSFTIGVDSARNVAGAQTGALDPQKNMFWSWNTGYIFTKLEGTSPQAPNTALVFHIGGFKAPHNTIRTISPSLKGATIQVQGTQTPTLHLKADVLKMFTGPTTVRFTQLYNTMGGANSVVVADNQAAGMFVVDYVHAN